MNRFNNSLAIGALTMTQLFSSAAIAEDKQPQNSSDNNSNSNSELIISADSECMSYSPIRSECDGAALNIEFETKASFWQFKFAGSAQDDGTGYLDGSTLDEMTIGVYKNNLYLDAGFFEVEHPVLSAFDDGPDRFMAPISLDNTLRRQTVSDQIGLRLGYTAALTDTWSASVNIAVTQSKYMYFDRNLSADIYGTDNVHTLLRQNELYPKRYMDAVRNIEVPELEPYSLNDLRNGIAPRVDLSDLKHNLNELKVSEHGQNFAKFVAWLHLEHSDGWDDIIDSVDTEKIAQKYNQIRTSTLDDVNGIELPDNLQQEILNRLGDYVSEEQAQQFEGLLQDALSDLQEGANASNAITAEQVKNKVTEVIEDLQGQLNDEIMSNPDVYYEIYRDTLRHLQGLYKSYQTASDTPSLHANIEISRLGEDLDWRLGANWNQLASGSSETVAEERMGIYSVLDWRFAQDWAYQNIVSVDYYKNHLGLEETDSASALFYNRISYDINDMVTAYVAAGASAEPIDGAFITAEIGARSCWSFMQDKSQICAQGAYEKNNSIDIAGKEFMGIEDAEGRSAKLSLTYQMTF